MVHFQRHFEKYALPKARQRPGGAAGGGVSFFVSKKMFENGPYLAHPVFKLAIWLVLQFFTI